MKSNSHVVFERVPYILLASVGYLIDKMLVMLYKKYKPLHI